MACCRSVNSLKDSWADMSALDNEGMPTSRNATSTSSGSPYSAGAGDCCSLEGSWVCSEDGCSKPTECPLGKIEINNSGNIKIKNSDAKKACAKCLEKWNKKRRIFKRCQFWAKGRCKNAFECEYWHLVDEEKIRERRKQNHHLNHLVREKERMEEQLKHLQRMRSKYTDELCEHVVFLTTPMAEP
mmetsp:Transcript_70660/g.140221  ORF Transcript_70660/g.140221 Transcript_70660/m.140221 type:complete len:186 (-) Transcript_70660:128-685(-)